MTVSATSHQSRATVGSLTERDLIARLQKRLPASPAWVLVGIGDDAAVVEAERNRAEVLTVDALVDGVHFDRAVVPPAAIGHRALAANLSDLAAMGAAPRLALLSLALPPTLPLDDFDGLAAGLIDLAIRYRTHVVGGNLTRSPGPLMIDITVAGTVKKRQTLTRGGARAGDEIYVSGTIGAAAAGLQMLRESLSTAGNRAPASAPPSTSRGSAPVAFASAVMKDTCVDRYLYPEPRIRLGLLLGRNRAATAAIDLSDGLADGIHRLADASQVGAVIEEDALPIVPDARAWFAERGLDPVLAALAGGDDYELLFTVGPRARRRLETARRHGGAPITLIGRCTADRAVLLNGAGGSRQLPRAGYEHFGRPDAAE